MRSVSTICGTALRRIVGIHGDANQFRAGARQLHDLIHGCGGIGRIGVGHRLHDDRMVSADIHSTDVHHDGLAALMCWHELFVIPFGLG